MLRLSCFALLVGIVLGLELKAQLNSQWQKFKTTHGKKYSGEEESKRQAIFKSNVEAILQHNLEHDMGEADFTLGINEFSDMPHEEFVKTMCGVKGPPIHNRTNQVFRPTEDSPVPRSVDWRDENIVSPVKNQGYPYSCGSCWAFSATAAIESAWAKAKGKLVTLSVQQMVDCATSDAGYDNHGCHGGFPSLAMEYIINNKGQDKDECYTYDSVQNDECRYDKSCNGATISKYVYVESGSESTLKEVVATVGPLSVAFYAGEPSFQNYKHGIYNPSYCSQNQNHAVLMIGYGTENGKDYWLLKNSWGTTWGDNGYVKLARNANNMCGITNAVCYPVV